MNAAAGKYTTKLNLWTSKGIDTENEQIKRSETVLWLLAN